MFRFYWPQEDVCDECEGTGAGAMLYISDVPVAFVCQHCSPQTRANAESFALNVSNEEELNGWDWFYSSFEDADCETPIIKL